MKREDPDLEGELVLLRVDLDVLRRDTRVAFARLGSKFPPNDFASLPPMRDELKSSHDFSKFASKAVEAVRIGEMRSDSTPEEQLRKLIQEEEEKRIQARETFRLKTEEDIRVAEILAAKARRRKSISRVLEALVSGVALTGALELIKYLASLHH